jgi:hypothetical protein
MDKLPSAHQIGDHVGVNLGYAGGIGAAKITAVHFVESKVWYDVSLQVSNPGEEPRYSRINYVDSALVMSRQDWLNINILPRDEVLELSHQITDAVELNHAVFISNEHGEIFAAGYGRDYQSALEQFELKINNTQEYRIVKY